MVGDGKKWKIECYLYGSQKGQEKLENFVEMISFSVNL